MNAHDILQAAAGHMRDRAATYDKPEGERSMGATVAAFEDVTGISMNEEQGYVFAAIAFSNGIDFKDRRGRSFRNISGFQFGRLLVVGAHELESKTSHWLCRCQCGNYCRVSISNLTSGKQVSCGCFRGESRAARAAISRKSEEHKAVLDRARKARYNKSEKGRASQARYFSRNREVCLERSAMRRLKNPESGRAAVRNRRARIREAKGSHSPSDIARLGVEQGWACAACDADIQESYHVDHVVAVAAGGDNGPDNLQLLCPRCNIRKSTKPLSVFLSEMWPSLFSASFEYFYHA